MNSRAFLSVLAVQEVRFFFTKPEKVQLFLTVSSHKKLCRIQPAEFMITERIYSFEKSDLSFLILNFLKADFTVFTQLKKTLIFSLLCMATVPNQIIYVETSVYILLSYV